MLFLTFLHTLACELIGSLMSCMSRGQGRRFMENEKILFYFSPYSGKRLKPFVRRNFDGVPSKLQVLRDIQVTNTAPGAERYTGCQHSSRC